MHLDVTGSKNSGTALVEFSFNVFRAEIDSYSIAVNVCGQE